jgi:hypothetical protein
MMPRLKVKEKQMIEPVQTFLENKGYTVYKDMKKHLEWKVLLALKPINPTLPDFAGIKKKK